MDSWIETLKSSGIGALGIAPSSFPISWEAYCRHLERGIPEHLEYLERNAHCRRDLNTIMPGTRSVICCAVPLCAPSKSLCQFALFCHMGDYHDVVRERIRSFVPVLRALHPEVQMVRICVDTAPVLERELAVRAGLGTIGYQHMLFHPTLGSYCALGELFVDADLTPYRAELEWNVSRKMPEKLALIPGAGCSCRAGKRQCVSACPVGALTDFGYDMGRCLAYWTTQHRGDIPEFFAAAMGDVIWGCDRCQTCCPRNRRVVLASAVRTPLHDIDLGTILTSSARQLERRLEGTPIAGANLHILQRNACIVVGNTRDSRYILALRDIVAHHSCDWVCRAAQRALRCLDLS